MCEKEWDEKRERERDKCLRADLLLYVKFRDILRQVTGEKTTVRVVFCTLLNYVSTKFDKTQIHTQMSLSLSPSSPIHIHSANELLYTGETKKTILSPHKSFHRIQRKSECGRI